MRWLYARIFYTGYLVRPGRAARAYIPDGEGPFPTVLIADNARLEIVEGAGHGFYGEEARAPGETMIGFIRENL